MKNKIIVIGKNGLLGSNLNSHLKHKNFVSNLGYKEFIKKDKKFEKTLITSSTLPVI